MEVTHETKLVAEGRFAGRLQTVTLSNLFHSPLFPVDCIHNDVSTSCVHLCVHNAGPTLSAVCAYCTTWGSE